ncbi:MAG: tripartite tricarboxylate transporter TctB family protein [Hyphomicrobiaceae bacterium]|jgi:hypothetical protein
MRTVDIVAAIGLLIFTALIAFVVIPSESADGVWYGLSPYFYPMVMLAGIAISSIGLLVQALTRPSVYADQPKVPISRAEVGFFLLAFAIIFVSTLVLHWFGTWVGGFVMIAGLMLFMGELSPLRIVAVAIPTLVVNYAIVTWGLQIPLP